MLKYTQKQARYDIKSGWAMDGNYLYGVFKSDFHKKLGNYEKIAIGHGVYGMNCMLIHSDVYGYVAIPNRSTALFCL